MSILEVSGLRKVYTSRLGGSRVEALRNVSFTAWSRASMSLSWVSPAAARPRC